MNRLSISFAACLLITGCSGGVDVAEIIDGIDVPETINDLDIPEPTVQTPGQPFTSPATAATESAFNDTFVSNNTVNIPWVGPAVSSETNVDYIAQAYNLARIVDPTVKEKLRMPQQANWDSYDTSEKVIYLINSERSARGMRPLRGIAPELVSSSGFYASELSDNGQFSHTYGTFDNSTDRLADWANVIAPPQTSVPVGNENATYNSFYIEELIAYVETSSGSTINEPEARAVYNFMYNDKSPTIGDAYAHRNIILVKDPAAAVIPAALGLVNNAQPLIGASAVEAVVSGKLRNTLVVHGVDPNSVWDISSITAPPGLIGPEAQSDCLSGTYTASDDGVGNNTSVCQ